VAQDKDTQERSHEATAHKLEQARRRGEVAQSRDVTSLGLYVGLLVALAGFAGAMALDLGAALLPFLEQPDQLLALQTPRALIGLIAGASLDALAGIAPLLLLPALGVVLALIAQQAFVFAGERLHAKWSRLSIIANARQRFGPKGLVEFAKTLLKLIAVSAVVSLVIWSSLDPDSRAGPQRCPRARPEPARDDAADPVAAARVDRGRRGRRLRLAALRSFEGSAG
jgi:flagellar biosynthesis protein FlhB